MKAPRRNPDQPLFVSEPLVQTGRVMVKDEDLCVHCGLCAERCPTDAWDMQKSWIEIPTPRTRHDARAQERCAARKRLHRQVRQRQRFGLASANALVMKAIFRMGVPVVGKNFFPSNIQGLPTWYEIRVTRDGWRARSGRVDLMVAMNAETYARDLREVAAGGWLVYDSTWPRRACTRATTSARSACRSRSCATSISRARARGP
jgi:ferredoxin